MPIAGEVLFRDRSEILTQMISEIQALIPDVYLGLDGNLRMLMEVYAGVGEAVFLAMQILNEDMFVQTANISALLKHGDQYGVYQLSGTTANGILVFAGAGGTYVPIGAEVAYEPFPGQGKYFFVTIDDGTIPDPGIPDAPSAALGSPGLVDGVVEYAVTFITSGGETALGLVSSPLTASLDQVVVSSIPVGGLGTTGRKVYRSLDGGDFLLIGTINDNTTTSITDNEGTPGAAAPTISTAERISLSAQSLDQGGRFNVAPGAISILVNVPDGITEVFNDDYFTGGSDPETVESLRARLLATLRNPYTGSKTDLKIWAEENPGVGVATVFPNDNLGTPTVGHVTIRLTGPNGALPTSETIAAVQADIDARDFANIVIHVASYDPVPTNVDADVTPTAEFTLAEITPTVNDAITALINSLQVGETLYIAAIYDAVWGLPGVADVIVTAPATNQTTASDEKRTPGTITLT